MAKTKIERISSIEEQIKQLENQRKQLIQKQKADERKERTRRLIERGAILESLIPELVNLTNEQIKTFLQKTVTGDFGKHALENITAQSGETATPQTTETAAQPNPSHTAKPTQASQPNINTAAAVSGHTTGKAG